MADLYSAKLTRILHNHEIGDKDGKINGKDIVFF